MPVNGQHAISEIHVGHRFRRDMGDIEALATSIRTLGLLHPITITRDGRLLAGQRRLEACRLLGWKTIPVNVLTEEKLT